jgi:glycosyltransferase involved in cell wall biosynthesis
LIPEWSLELAELAYNPVGRRSVRRAIRQFRPDFIYDRYNLYTTAAIDAAHEFGIPVLLEVNSPIALERAQYEMHPLRFSRLAHHYERRVYGSADHIFAVSTPLKDYLVHQIGVPPDRITVLVNGANPRHFDPSASGASIRRRFNIEGEIVIGYVGSLRPWQGLDLLVSAFTSLAQKLDRLHLLIVGSGSMEADLKNQVRGGDMEKRVTFTGPVDHHEMVRYLAAIDIGVSPHATFYASPMKILEYMAMGLATIAPRMSNIKDIVDDGETALLFKAGSSESLTAALERLVKDTELASRLGRAARYKIESRLNWMYNAARVAEQAARLLNPEASPPVDDRGRETTKPDELLNAS